MKSLCKWKRKLEKISTSREVVVVVGLYIHARTDGKWVASLSSSCVCDSSSSDSKKEEEESFSSFVFGLLCCWSEHSICQGTAPRPRQCCGFFFILFHIAPWKCCGLLNRRPIVCATSFHNNTRRMVAMTHALICGSSLLIASRAIIFRLCYVIGKRKE